MEYANDPPDYETKKKSGVNSNISVSFLGETFNPIVKFKLFCFSPGSGSAETLPSCSVAPKPPPNLEHMEIEPVRDLVPVTADEQDIPPKAIRG